MGHQASHSPPPWAVAILPRPAQNRIVAQPYRSLEAELHDAFWDAEEAPGELPLMADFLRRQDGIALEIGCGSGRLLLPLARQGFAIEGLELSGEMIALAQQRASAANHAVVLHQGDMTSWLPPRRYGSLLAPAFTLQLAADPLETLRHWNSWLLPGGGLYLTTFIPYAELLGELPEGTWYLDHEITLPDGTPARIDTRHRIDRSAGILEREHRYTVGGNPPRHHQSNQSLRWAAAPQMREWLDAAGFKTISTLLDFDPNHRNPAPDHRHFNGILTFLAISDH